MTLEEIKKAIIEWQKEDESRSVLFLGVQMNDNVTKMESAAAVAGDGKALSSTMLAYSIGDPELRDGFGEFYGTLNALIHFGDNAEEISKTLENEKKDRTVS